MTDSPPASYHPLTKHGKSSISSIPSTARAGTRRCGLLSAIRNTYARNHTKAPYEINLLWEMPRVLNRPGRARTVTDRPVEHHPLARVRLVMGGRWSIFMRPCASH